MANVLGESMQETISTLSAQGWSSRRIAKELGVNRKTVDAYIRKRNDVQNGPNLPTGSSIRNGPESLSAPYREIIESKIECGLNAVRIFQDLRDDCGYTGGYDSVLRFVRRLVDTSPVPVRRIESPPGEEAQIDFGRGAPIIIESGKRRGTWVFRIVLSHSRKAYSESVFHQTTENFIRAIESSFRYFTGVPRTLVTDNLKAAVRNPDWYDPELQPVIREFCRHYNTTLLPTKPFHPEHKGKVEKSIDYVKNNALKGRSFSSLNEQNLFLLDWEARVADTRIHGTTKKQVGEAFEQEKSSLQPLPSELFPAFEMGERSVGSDGHIEVAGSYYSVPPEYTGRRVWVKWTPRFVEVLNQRFQSVAVHARAERGRFSTNDQHIPEKKRSAVERGPEYLMRRIRFIGPAAETWSRSVLSVRKIEGIRVLQGLISLTGRYTAKTVDAACSAASDLEIYYLRGLKNLLGNQTEQMKFEFTEQHPLIRDISEYKSMVPEFSECAGTDLIEDIP